ncbi:MAG: VWA domain-containing protein [Lentisphaerae bacterium]|nr:VWA domain-containing protein [Lentisphaerota bacterium]
MLNPLFLWAFAAALIPLILHLWQRQRIVVMPFSTVRFLKVAQQRASSRIRLENILLWLLRTLLVLLLVMAFTMPVLRLTSLRQLVGAARRDIAIVLDVSYSMDYVSGQNRVWLAARDAAIAVIEAMRPGDRACLFLADEDVTPLIAQLTPDLSLVLGQIRSLSPGTTTAQLRPAVEAALAALKESRREKELFIITDGQKLPWNSFQPLPEQTDQPDKTDRADAAAAATAALPFDTKDISADTAIIAALLGVASPDNSAPLDIEIQPTVLMPETPGQLAVKLLHNGPEQSLNVSLAVNGQAASQRSVSFEKDGRATCVFALPPLKLGTHAALIETSPDGLMLDNSFYFLLRIHEKLPVLCVGTEEDAFFLMRALNPGGTDSAITAQRIDPAALGADALAGAACVFLCNAVPLEGQALLALEQYVQRGGVAVIFPGNRAAIADYANWTCLPAKPVNLADFGADAQRRVLRLVKRGDPLFQGMHLPSGTYPTIAVTRELQWDKLETAAEVVIAAEREVPMLLRRKVGNGYVLAFSVSADRRWSNLPLSPFFLPIIHQVVFYGAGVEQSQSFIWTGRNLVLADLVGALAPGTELRDPAGRSVTLRPLKNGQDNSLVIEAVTQSGFYTQHSPARSQAEPAFAVNVRRSESDLTRVNPADLPALTGISELDVVESKEDLLRLVKERRLGRPLAEPLLWLAFLLAGVELFIANRASRKSRTLTEQLKIDLTGRVKGVAAGG